MKRIIGNIFTILVVIIIIVMSVLLLSYNEYRVSQFGNNTLLIVDNDMLNFKKGSLLIVEGCDPKEVKAGDYVFYYDTSSKKVSTVLSKIESIYKTEQGEISFTLPNEFILEGEYIIGKKEDTKEYKNIGAVLSVLESKWGNLFLVVLPAFILFVYEIINVIIEVKKYKNRGKKKKIIIIEEDDDEEEEKEVSGDK